MSQHEFLGKYHMAMRKVLQNKQLTLHSAHSSHVYRLEYSYTRRRHCIWTQSREKWKLFWDATPQMLKAQFREARSSPKATREKMQPRHHLHSPHSGGLFHSANLFLVCFSDVSSWCKFPSTPSASKRWLTPQLSKALRISYTDYN